jgi:DNA polymerase-3 subunit gamma/tau
LPAQALYLKWRPRTFDDVIGQGHITRALRNALIQNRVRHAYLFNGPRGTGKTTMARLLAKAVNCQHKDPARRPCGECRFCEAIDEGRFLDLIEIDAASHNGVDDVRDLRDKIAFAPGEGRFKVYIFDEVHRFSGAAFDALLKTLEEPPEHAIFVLATTELDKVPATIRSRALIFEFRRVSVHEVADRLQLIAENEGFAIDRAVLELVAQQGTGSVRDSISLLDQLIADPDEAISLELAERVLGTAGSRVVGKLVQAVVDNDAASGLELLNQAIEEGADPGQLGRQIVEYLRDLMLVQTGGPTLVDVTDEQRIVLQKQASLISRAALIRAVRTFNGAVSEIRSGWQPQLPLELALVESTRPLQEPEESPAPRRETAPPPSSAPTARQTAPASAPRKADKKTSPAPETPAISLSQLRQDWQLLLEELKTQRQYNSLRAQLEHAEVRSLDEKVLVLSVANPTFQSMLTERSSLLAEVFKERFGVELQIKIVVGAAKVGDKVDATITDDPVVADQLKSGGTIAYVDDSQEGNDE